MTIFRRFARHLVTGVIAACVLASAGEARALGGPAKQAYNALNSDVLSSSVCKRYAADDKRQSGLPGFIVHRQRIRNISNQVNYKWRVSGLRLSNSFDNSFLSNEDSMRFNFDSIMREYCRVRHRFMVFNARCANTVYYRYQELIVTSVYKRASCEEYVVSWRVSRIRDSYVHKELKSVFVKAVQFVIRKGDIINFAPRAVLKDRRISGQNGGLRISSGFPYGPANSGETGGGDHEVDYRNRDHITGRPSHRPLGFQVRQFTIFFALLGSGVALGAGLFVGRLCERRRRPGHLIFGWRSLVGLLLVSVTLLGWGRYGEPLGFWINSPLFLNRLLTLAGANSGG